MYHEAVVQTLEQSHLGSHFDCAVSYILKFEWVMHSLCNLFFPFLKWGFKLCLVQVVNLKIERVNLFKQILGGCCYCLAETWLPFYVSVHHSILQTL